MVTWPLTDTAAEPRAAPVPASTTPSTARPEIANDVERIAPPSHSQHWNTMASTNHYSAAARKSRRARDNMAYAGRILLASVALTGTLHAQTRNDSLAIRLQRAEAAIETLQKQLAEQADQGVKSRSRVDVEIFGRVLMNGFANSRRVNNVDNPQFVRPDTVGGFPSRGVGMAIRQTRLGVAVHVPDVWGGKFDGDMDVDFSGGQQPSSGGRTFPLMRLRTARG